MKKNAISSLVVLAIASILGGCNEDSRVNADSPGTSNPLPARQSGRVPLDVLLVVDHSATMCEEQAALGQYFAAFLSTVESYTPLDYRVAVINAATGNDAGKFQYHPRTELDAKCNADQLMAAGECAQLGNKWKATGSPLVNWQGQSFDQCRLECETSADCDAAIIDSTAGRECARQADTCEWQCIKSLDFDGMKACALQPQADGCPAAAELRALLTGDTSSSVPLITRNTVDLLPCITTTPPPPMPANGRRQPFQSALLALDREGPNAVQAQEFLRDDAFLLILFMTDEDDCSRANGRSGSSNSSCCALDNDLVSVSEVADRLRGLHSDPSKVLVATLGGALDNTASQTASGEAYWDWRCQLFSPSKVTTHACLGATGPAGLSTRMIALADEMGRYGSFYNVCAPGSIPTLLETVARNISPELMRVCLPSRPLLNELLQPWIMPISGPARPVAAGEYDLISDATCRPEADYLAVRLKRPLDPGDTISVSYSFTAIPNE
ncbi:MAG: hypothetical protein VX223_08090 [Myxococcota bacterium]|nr:hypothetical protein [Myxococcota bacterium]